MTPERLIAHSNVAAVVSDPRQSDNPIIACNQAFERLTGYCASEIIGRNCRFLRGPATEAEPAQMLREAVAEHRATIVELTNYRKDGTPFRNAVMIAPLFDEAGALQYFLGSQMEVEPAGESRQDRARTRIAALTRRQHQILEGLAGGALNKQIAFAIGVTERTVKMHRAALLKSLGVRTVADAIRLAIEAGY